MNSEIEMYLKKYPTEIVLLFSELRNVIYTCTQIEPEEKLWAKLPSYYVGDHFIRLIPFKDHINIEAADMVNHLEELKDYKLTPKGMLQIGLKQDVPKEALKSVFANTLGCGLYEEVDRAGCGEKVYKPEI